MPRSAFNIKLLIAILEKREKKNRLIPTQVAKYKVIKTFSKRILKELCKIIP